MLRKFFLYLLRWQMSTPILAICVVWLNQYGTTVSTVVANLIGGCLFFWIDRLIFNGNGRKK